MKGVLGIRNKSFKKKTLKKEVIKEMKGKLLVILSLLVCCYISVVTDVYAVGTTADTVIQNGGNAGDPTLVDVTGDSLIQWVIGTSTSYATCSPMSVTVSSGYAIAELPTPTDETLSPGSTAYYAYTACNVGNSTDTFSLSVSTTDGQAWPLRILQDDNEDGKWDAGETTEVSDTGGLANDTTFYFFVAVTIPEAAVDNDSSTVKLIVKDQYGAATEDDWPITGNDELNDETLTKCAATSIDLVKGSNVSEARPFTDEVVYTSSFTVTGSGIAKNVIYRDKLPAECTIVTGSTLYKNIWPTTTATMTLAEFDDDGEVVSDVVTIRLNDLTAGTSGYVQFKVTVK